MRPSQAPHSNNRVLRSARPELVITLPVLRAHPLTRGVRRIAMKFSRIKLARIAGSRLVLSFAGGRSPCRSVLDRQAIIGGRKPKTSLISRPIREARRLIASTRSHYCIRSGHLDSQRVPIAVDLVVVGIKSQPVLMTKLLGD
jgi:hypothetical protein